MTRLRSRGFSVSYGAAGLAALLAILFFAFHIPFLPQSLEDLDSINFALGVRHFDVAHHQPHPPGYPVYIALGKITNAIVASEAKALSLISVVAGALSVFALVPLFRRIAGRTDATDASRDPNDDATRVALLAAVLAGTAPLYWFTAARPLSDMPGLAAALAVQALTLRAKTVRDFIVAAFLGGLAAGLRSQVVWLTVPLLVFCASIAGLPPSPSASASLAGARAGKNASGGGKPRATAAGIAVAFFAGILLWAIPLVVLTGGPAAYWRAIFSQGAEDLGGVQMLWTQPTARQLLTVLNSTFVAPWGTRLMAGIVIALGAMGVFGLVRQRHPAMLTLAVAFGPYLVLDFLFQESITTRYALPLVVPVAFAAAWGLVALGWTGALIGAVFLVAFDAHVGGTSVAAYAREPAPAFRLLGDMRNEAGRETPVLAMHRREDLDLRRPIAWVGAAMPLSTRLSAPPKREWLELVEYWNSGGRQPIWFVADPLRTDLALIDRRDASVTRYRWQLEHHALIGGVRPDVMDWYRFGEPAWYLGEGWALTPETGGVAKEAGYGPGNGPIQGWIRRTRQSATVMLGGRNLAASGPATHVRMSIDGRTIAEPAVAPGFFLTMLHVPESALKGSDEYARVELTAESPNIAIEQFDAQPSDRVLFGFADGWHEQEYDPALGLQWRWISERGLLRVHAGGHSLLLSLRAEAPSVYFSNPSRVTVRAGARMVFEQPFSSAVEIVARIPAELVAGDESTITIESSQMYVPAERSRRTRDRRHLALRVFECSVREAR